MRFLHISDLHIGKRLHEFSMLEDQKYILNRIIDIADRERVDAVLIAGDIYDRPVPSAEAVQVYDRFLTALAERGKMIFAVSGNHDSAERIAFGAQLMRGYRVYVSPVYDGTVTRIPLRDEYGELSVYLLPFLKPATVRHALEARENAGEPAPSGEGREPDGNEPLSEESREPEIGTYQEAVRAALERAGVPGEGEPAPSGEGQEPEIGTYQEAVWAALERAGVPDGERSLLVAHQFVTGAGRCDSEEIVVGGLDNIDAGLFDAFDYVALGHIHSPQSVGRQTVRYAGTPLKYSFSEAEQIKSVTIAELKEKGTVELHTVPLSPLRDLRKIRGSYEEVMSLSFWQGTNREDYVQVTLTDEEDIPDGLAKLRTVYPNLMRLEYDNRRTRCDQKLDAVPGVENKSEAGLFFEFYELQNNQPVSEAQREFVEKLVEELKNGGME